MHSVIGRSKYFGAGRDFYGPQQNRLEFYAIGDDDDVKRSKRACDIIYYTYMLLASQLAMVYNKEEPFLKYINIIHTQQVHYDSTNYARVFLPAKKKTNINNTINEFPIFSHRSQNTIARFQWARCFGHKHNGTPRQLEPATSKK